MQTTLFLGAVYELSIPRLGCDGVIEALRFLSRTFLIQPAAVVPVVRCNMMSEQLCGCPNGQPVGTKGAPKGKGVTHAVRAQFRLRGNQVLPVVKSLQLLPDFFPNGLE